MEKTVDNGLLKKQEMEQIMEDNEVVAFNQFDDIAEINEKESTVTEHDNELDSSSLKQETDETENDMNIHEEFLFVDCNKEQSQYEEEPVLNYLSEYILVPYKCKKPFKCSVCNYRCSYPSLLKIHTRTHTGEKPYKCSLCDCCFSLSSHLKRHMRLHSGDKPYKCNLCDYCTSIASFLIDHMSIHTDEQPSKCSLCDYSNTSSQHLTEHIKTHTCDKPFKCSLCDYCTTLSSNLKKHLTTHPGVKPYECSLCYYCTSRSSDLTRHMRRAHKGVKS